MSVSARLAMFVTGLMVAVTAGWGLGTLLRPPTPPPGWIVHTETGPHVTPLRRAGRGRSVTAASLGPDATPLSVELLLGGMTCGACANRIERTLNKIDGVHAMVNYATEKASVTLDGTATVDDLVAAVERAGYTAEILGMSDEAGSDEPADDEAAPDPVVAAQRTRLLVCGAVGARDRHGDGAGAAVHVLAVGVVDARRAGGRVGRVAAALGRVVQPPPRGRDNGHARVGRDDGRVRLVALRTLPRAGGHHPGSRTRSA